MASEYGIQATEVESEKGIIGVMQDNSGNSCAILNDGVSREMLVTVNDWTNTLIIEGTQSEFKFLPLNILEIKLRAIQEALLESRIFIVGIVAVTEGFIAISNEDTAQAWLLNAAYKVVQTYDVMWADGDEEDDDYGL